MSKYLVGIIFLIWGMNMHANTTQNEARAIFAGGCFWCLEKDFDKVDGVLDVRSGYTGGSEPKPTYRQVSSGSTGHTEAIEIVYDPNVVSYEQLLVVFWRNIDPFDAKGQFCDKGSQYRAGIFYLDETQKKLALSSRDEIIKTIGKSVVTEVTEASTFHLAEDYHQDYYKKNPMRYNLYRYGCGRDKRLKQLWG